MYAHRLLNGASPPRNGDSQSTRYSERTEFVMNHLLNLALVFLRVDSIDVDDSIDRLAQKLLKALGLL